MKKQFSLYIIETTKRQHKKWLLYNDDCICCL
jgi:hypothetical protein